MSRRLNDEHVLETEKECNKMEGMLKSKDIGNQNEFVSTTDHQCHKQELENAVDSSINKNSNVGDMKQKQKQKVEKSEENEGVTAVNNKNGNGNIAIKNDKENPKWNPKGGTKKEEEVETEKEKEKETDKEKGIDTEKIAVTEKTKETKIDNIYNEGNKDKYTEIENTNVSNTINTQHTTNGTNTIHTTNTKTATNTVTTNAETASDARIPSDINTPPEPIDGLGVTNINNSNNFTENATTRNTDNPNEMPIDVRSMNSNDTFDNGTYNVSSFVLEDEYNLTSRTSRNLHICSLFIHILYVAAVLILLGKLSYDFTIKPINKNEIFMKGLCGFMLIILLMHMSVRIYYSYKFIKKLEISKCLKRFENYFHGFAIITSLVCLYLYAFRADTFAVNDTFKTTVIIAILYYFTSVVLFILLHIILLIFVIVVLILKAKSPTPKRILKKLKIMTYAEYKKFCQEKKYMNSSYFCACKEVKKNEEEEDEDEEDEVEEEMKIEEKRKKEKEKENENENENENEKKERQKEEQEQEKNSEKEKAREKRKEKKKERTMPIKENTGLSHYKEKSLAAVTVGDITKTDAMVTDRVNILTNENCNEYIVDCTTNSFGMKKESKAALNNALEEILVVPVKNGDGEKGMNKQELKITNIYKEINDTCIDGNVKEKEMIDVRNNYATCELDALKKERHAGSLNYTNKNEEGNIINTVEGNNNNDKRDNSKKDDNNKDDNKDENIVVSEETENESSKLKGFLHLFLRRLKKERQKRVEKKISEILEDNNSLHISIDNIDLVCSVCCTEYADDDDICILPCNYLHYFHKTCIFTWLKKNNECPFCRENIKKIFKRKRRFRKKKEQASPT